MSMENYKTLFEKVEKIFLFFFGLDNIMQNV